MSFEAAKCPNCGAQLQLDNSMETGFCVYCGTKFIVHDAIQRMKIEVSGQVSMSGISTVENDINRGKQCLTSKDWMNAFKFFVMALNKQANSFEAWHGCLLSITQDFSFIDFSWVNYKGNTGLESVVIHSIQLSDNIQKQKLYPSIKQLPHLIDKVNTQLAQEQVRKAQKKRNIAAFIWLFFAFLFIISNLSENNFGYTMLILGIILLFIGVSNFLPRSKEKYINHQWLQYTQELETIVERAGV